ncbi:hypothetical protein [Kitasatospora sp. MAP5-34]|uniref:3-dehydroquinate synthase family protein n=1 Tax=Kitasatospora sp. MAP5-34 TaxID=3035102 RepID=UPI002476AFF5|nr:hypothetical protein [Kitasatospora sp. MAP5-34]MDH6575364.1 3-dehydroquinate synthase [Kitasatospora sp. MAP5-34]
MARFTNPAGVFTDPADVLADQVDVSTSPVDADSPVDVDRELQTGSAHYRVKVRSGDRSWDELARDLGALDADRYVVITEGDTPAGLLTRIEAQVLRIPGTCTMQTVERLAEQILLAGVTRRTVVIGVGGDRTGGVAGLLAGLLFQGLRLVHVPTTLSAMCGSALSLRHTLPSAVLGTHHAPELVWCQLDLLRERPADELRADLGQVIRSVLAVCPAWYDQLAAVLNPDAHYSPRELASFITLCADARAAVTAYDPLERGPGRALAYGSTIGRAVQLLTGGTLSQGHVDGLGMLVAARIAAHLGLLDAEGERAHRELLQRNGSPVALPAGVDPEALVSAVRLAAARGGEAGLVLLAGLGRPYVADGSLLTQVGEDTLRAGAEALRPGGVPASRGASVPAPVPAQVLAQADR